MLFTACLKLENPSNGTSSEGPSKVPAISNEECFTSTIEGYDVSGKKISYTKREGMCFSDPVCNVGSPLPIFENWKSQCTAVGGEVLSSKDELIFTNGEVHGPSCTLCSVDSKFQMSPEETSRYFCLDGKRFISLQDSNDKIEFIVGSYKGNYQDWRSKGQYYCTENGIATFPSTSLNFPLDPYDRMEMEILSNGNLLWHGLEYNLETI